MLEVMCPHHRLVIGLLIFRQRKTGSSQQSRYKAEFPTAWIVRSCPPAPAYEGFNLPGAASQMSSSPAKNRSNIQRSTAAADSVSAVETVPELRGEAPLFSQAPLSTKAEEASDSLSNKRERNKRRRTLKNIFMGDAVPSEPTSCPPFPPHTPRSRFSFFREAFSTNRERTREPVRYSASRDNNSSWEDASPLPRKVNPAQKPPAKPAIRANPVFAPFAEETQRRINYPTIHDVLVSPVLSSNSVVSSDMADAPARAPIVQSVYSLSSLEALALKEEMYRY